MISKIAKALILVQERFLLAAPVHYLYHGTDQKSAEDIIKNGIDMDKSTKGYYGKGFYTSTSENHAKTSYADFSDDEGEGIVLKFKLNPGFRILDLDNPKDFEAWKKSKLEEKRYLDNFDKIMVNAGFDGLRDEGGFGGIVIYNPKAITLATKTASKYVGNLSLLEKEAAKYENADQLLRSGGFSIDNLDRVAFGFAPEDIKELDPKDLNIKWKEDLISVKNEFKKSGLNENEWAKKIDLSEPIDVVYENGKFYIDDGHHRYYAAKILNKKLKVNLVIKDKPIAKITGDKNYDYDKFHRSFFSSIKTSSNKLDKAVNRVRFLVNNQNKSYAVAIDQASKEFDVSTKSISNELNPPKKQIKWVKPDLSNESGEYFENPTTRSFFKKMGYVFEAEDELINFLKKGKLKEISRTSLNPIENITIDSKDFAKELQSDDYASGYYSLRNKLLKEGKIELDAPILIKFPKIYYLLSGNRRINLAWNNSLNVKFWVVEAENISPKQQSLFSSSLKSIHASNIMEVYRGEFSGNKGGRYWSTDKEWAAQFTQTGRIEEVKTRKIREQDVFSPNPLPYAGDPDEIDKAVKEAKSGGFKAVRLDEGSGEPDSIYVFIPSALKIASIPKDYPKAGNVVDGLKVRSSIPNMNSVSATFNDYETLNGIRIIPMSDFGDPFSVFYATNDFQKSKALAKEIEESKEINPLIIAIDDEGPYVLEGAHRFVALHYLGKTEFPALVVKDLS